MWQAHTCCEYVGEIRPFCCCSAVVLKQSAQEQVCHMTEQNRNNNKKRKKQKKLLPFSQKLRSSLATVQTSPMPWEEQQHCVGPKNEQESEEEEEDKNTFTEA